MISRVAQYNITNVKNALLRKTRIDFSFGKKIVQNIVNASCCSRKAGKIDFV